MSDTPRTDAILANLPITAANPITTTGNQHSALLGLCRKMERQLARERRDGDLWRMACEQGFIAPEVQQKLGFAWGNNLTP